MKESYFSNKKSTICTYWYRSNRTHFALYKKNYNEIYFEMKQIKTLMADCVFKTKKNMFHKKHLNFIEECRQILANSRKLKSHFWPDLTDLTWVACFQFHPEKQTWDFCFLTECNYFDWTNFLLIEECGFTFMKEIECISDLNFSSCWRGRAQHKQFYTNLNNYLIILIN